MGSTISKVNHGLKASLLPSEKTRRGRTSPTVGCIDSQKPLNAKPSGRHKPKDKKSISVKRRKPRYKKVTKSMVGRPSNFKHIGHMGAKDTNINPVEANIFSAQMMDISTQLNTPIRPRQIKPKNNNNNNKKSLPRAANDYYQYNIISSSSSSSNNCRGSRKPVNSNILLLEPPSLRTLMA
ncbi:hypothetical protein J3Q64DRAFT_1714759 [Phycomyces blakesleeanus]|uniref:CRIB domain-containing protein n=2 Tax=Phycomyces blakesleeanus TaxID=4837 RepID=A0A167QDB4_PHYB8|nr:hypothetical protein PHYBLDRAFT_58575 [Phycomyces blakesleeanus NRRL 1555(-)]OAD79526.1 hypothetical protein PHYBLDRAFT_58575 [Phycomyces blakesleeanus NRRL 1555(-)]|eukprot:XP_018297566.1 hypothetical protein PHYBLDRAFT_58575 [Phycomyces blakesleeanus NRRL 1555(-)]